MVVERSVELGYRCGCSGGVEAMWEFMRDEARAFMKSAEDTQADNGR